MDLAEIKARLDAAMPLRIPMFDPNEPPGVKISQLEQYLRTAAYHRAELEEALHWAWEALKLLRGQWMDVEGWQSIAGRSATQAEITAAKRVVAPETWAGLQEAESVVRSIDRQIKRLEKDDTTTSRSYTLLSGG